MVKEIILPSGNKFKMHISMHHTTLDMCGIKPSLDISLISTWGNHQFYSEKIKVDPKSSSKEISQVLLELEVRSREAFGRLIEVPFVGFQLETE